MAKRVMNRNLLARAVAVLVFFAGAPAWGMEGTEGTERSATENALDAWKEGRGMGDD